MSFLVYDASVCLAYTMSSTACQFFVYHSALYPFSCSWVLLAAIPLLSALVRYVFI